MRSFWFAKENKPSEFAIVDLQHPCDVRAGQINYTDYKNNVFENDSTVSTKFKLYSSLDGKNRELIHDLSNGKRDRPNAYIELSQPVHAGYIKYERVYVKAVHLAISDIHIFGNGLGKIPQTPQNFSAVRQKDERNATINWSEVEGAVGYNILWGIEKNKLYQTYQV